MKNPLITRLAKKAEQSVAYRMSRNKEKKLALKIGGRTTLASGAKKEKGDVRKNGIARLEHKLTGRNSFSVTVEMIQKIVNASVACEEIPAIIIEFVDNSTGKQLGEIAVVPVDDLVRLISKE
jgi:hypothetical protein